MIGYAASNVFTEKQVALWRRAAHCVKQVPEEWGVRCHELARAMHVNLADPMVLWQDGQVGCVQHTWLYLGERPKYEPCSDLNCRWAATFSVEVKELDRWALRYVCGLHRNLYSDRRAYRFVPERHTVLDVYFPGAWPPVVLLDSKTQMLSYSPGPPRDDIDEEMVQKLLKLWY